MRRNRFSAPSIILILGVTIFTALSALQAQAGSGTFQPYVKYATGSWPYSVAISDLNRDGKLDLAVANNTSNSVSVLLGNGDGTFQAHVDYDTGAVPQSVAIGDFDGNGKPDLVVANGGENTLSVLLGCGNGQFHQGKKYVTGNDPKKVAVADLNGDRKLDLIVTNLHGANISVFLGNGDGTFQQRVDYPVGMGPYWVAVGDFNNDGKLDLTVPNWNDYTEGVLLGNGDGTFQPQVIYPVGNNPTSVNVGDVNSDGNLDLVVDDSAYLGGTPNFSVLLGNGDGTFQPRVDYGTTPEPVEVILADFNSDGKLDVAASVTENFVNVFLGNGDGTFQPHSDYAVESYPYALEAGDFNHDGAVDIVTADVFSASVAVLLNSGGTQITLTSSSDPSTLGQPVTFTAAVAPTFASAGNLSGNVTFLDGSVKLAVVPLVSGQASFTTSSLAEGNHTIQVSYSGDTLFNRNKRQLLQTITP